MTPADPGLVLRRAVIAWGLGHLALGARATGYALMAAELAWLAALGFLTTVLADTTLHVVPFVAGIGFVACWAWQAVAAYRAARARTAAAQVAPTRSPAIAIGWLSVPLLVWTTGFWLLGGAAATPAAVLDRFVRDWTSGELRAEAWPAAAIAAAEDATERLDRLCADGLLRPRCGPTEPDRFRDVRVSVVAEASDVAWAMVDAVAYERRETRLLGIFGTHELAPVPIERLMRIELRADPAPLGSRRWRLDGAD